MSLYFDEKFAFATKHEKDALLGNAFKERLGVELVVPNIDTDLFGTFSGEIERSLSPLETAIAKARAGIEITGLEFGIASEGSIGNDPLVPFLVSDIEIMVLVDKKRDLVIHESHRSFEIVSATKEVSPGEDLEEYLERVDFPAQKLILKIGSLDSLKTIKSIDNKDNLVSGIKDLAKESPNGLVKIEPDFRSHNSPSRQVNIKTLGDKFIQRLLNTCSLCGAPGFGQTTYEKGVNCEACGNYNEGAIRHEILSCVKCNHQENGELINEYLDPAKCGFCNP